MMTHLIMTETAMISILRRAAWSAKESKVISGFPLFKLLYEESASDSGRYEYGICVVLCDLRRNLAQDSFLQIQPDRSIVDAFVVSF